MKKLIFVFLFCTYQVSVSQGIEFGPLVGGNFSSIREKDFFTNERVLYDIKFGVMLGAYSRFKVSEKFSIQPELMFAQYGAIAKDYKVRLNYITLPVLAKVNFTPEIFALTGPQVGVLVGGESANEGIYTYKGIYFSWMLGAGYSFRGIGLDIILRYNLGLNGITKPVFFRDPTNWSVGSFDSDTKMSSFQIVFAYRLLGGEKK